MQPLAPTSPLQNGKKMKKKKTKQSKRKKYDHDKCGLIRGGVGICIFLSEHMLHALFEASPQGCLPSSTAFEGHHDNTNVSS